MTVTQRFFVIATVDACLTENGLCCIPTIHVVARSFHVWEDEGVGGCNASFTSDTLMPEHIHCLDTFFWHKARHKVVALASHVHDLHRLK